jgi:hypothetical protein
VTHRNSLRRRCDLTLLLSKNVPPKMDHLLTLSGNRSWKVREQHLLLGGGVKATGPVCSRKAYNLRRLFIYYYLFV